MATPRSFADLYNWLVSVAPFAWDAAKRVFSFKTGWRVDLGSGGLKFADGTTQTTAPTDAGVTNTPALLDGNCAALWRLDEAAGPWIDLVAGYSFGADSTATLPTVVSGVFGNGLSFTTGNAVKASADSAFRALVGNSWTWEAWFCPTASPATLDQTLFSLHDASIDSESIGIYLFNGALNCQWGTGAGSHPQVNSSSLGLAVGQWAHLAVICTMVTSTSFSILLLQDARVVGSGTISAAPPSPATHNIFIGDGHPAALADLPLLGIIDDIRVSKVARSNLDIYRSFIGGVRAQ
jgi:hypothetical protein